jgi:hypothetical protein
LGNETTLQFKISWFLSFFLEGTFRFVLNLRFYLGYLLAFSFVFGLLALQTCRVKVPYDRGQSYFELQYAMGTAASGK